MRAQEHPIRERPAAAAVVAAVTAAIAPLVVPPIAVGAPATPTDSGSFRVADLQALLATRTGHAERADRAERGLYPPPPEHPRGAAVQVAVAPPAPQPPAPAPVVPVRYVPRHSTVVRRARVKTSNAGRYYAPPPISGSASDLVQFALTLRGRPYVFGAAGPNVFDCSGLVDYVFAHFGIRLPHKAAAFFGVGSPVSRADLQPGDIIVMAGGAHAGIALGGGLMLHAPHTGSVVQISPIWSFSAARRML